jgi:dTDP-4-amino-4,6-dideoxygalactose transaminase
MSAPEPIPFNRISLSGKEQDHIASALASGKISGNGTFTHACEKLLEEKLNARKVLLTTSCTDALEMAALLLHIGPGDEVLIPSYTFVSTANPFYLRGAKLVFADSRADHPNIDVDEIERLITPATKAIVLVHYGGVSAFTPKLKSLKEKHGFAIIEDAAHAYGSADAIEGKALGTIGDIGCISFHDSKNIICGEGGCIIINREDLIQKAEIIREKGTNRSAFLRKEIEKYEWVDAGSSYLPSELEAAFLLAQLENDSQLTAGRVVAWSRYHSHLGKKLSGAGILFSDIAENTIHNSHIFYLVCRSAEERNKLCSFLDERQIKAVFHYQSLHNSPFFREKYTGSPLPNSDRFSGQLLRLPLFSSMTPMEVDRASDAILEFYAL